MTEAEKELIEAVLMYMPVESRALSGGPITPGTLTHIYHLSNAVRAERAPKPRYYTQASGTVGLLSCLWVHDREGHDAPSLMPERWANILVDALNAKEKGKHG